MLDASRESLDLALDLDRLIRLMHINVHPKALAVDEQRVGPLGGMVLFEIADRGPIPVQTLGKRFGRDKGQMTRAVQMLERKNLVERIRSEHDGRVVLVCLTDEGRALLAKFTRVVAEVVSSLLEPLNEIERDQFGALISKIVAHDREE